MRTSATGFDNFERPGSRYGYRDNSRETIPLDQRNLSLPRNTSLQHRNEAPPQTPSLQRHNSMYDRGRYGSDNNQRERYGSGLYNTSSTNLGGYDRHGASYGGPRLGTLDQSAKEHSERLRDERHERLTGGHNYGGHHGGHHGGRDSYSHGHGHGPGARDSYGHHERHNSHHGGSRDTGYMTNSGYTSNPNSGQGFYHERHRETSRNDPGRGYRPPPRASYFSPPRHSRQNSNPIWDDMN